MSSCASSSLLRRSRKPIAAGVAALFAVSATSAWATPPPVTKCLDDGSAGTLRYAVDPANGAVSGDTIDMTALGLVCSTITLAGGPIMVTQKDLTIKGAGKHALYIQQPLHGGGGRVIFHSYPGTSGHLNLQDLSVRYGYIRGSGGTFAGGCVASNGWLTLNHVGVYYCSAISTGLSSDVPTPKALGGGVFAATLTITNGSVLAHDTASATNSGVRAQGGCAWVGGNLDMIDSIVSNCEAIGPVDSPYVHGGGIETRGITTIKRSIVALNHSSYSAGVNALTANPAATTTTISNSTIAYNSANVLTGGVASNSGTVNINNSTIVLNSAGTYTYTYKTKTYNAGVGVSIYSGNGVFSLQSTIIANNSANGTQEDLAFGGSTGLAFAASNNLVRAYLSDVTLPTGQGNLPIGTCPKLGHPRNNGGSTYTFAPQSGSPVIDGGNNTANDPYTGVPAVYDQRGGPPPPPIAQPPDGYPRVSGPSADIGAHEVQQSDIVFYAEFETGCE